MNIQEIETKQRSLLEIKRIRKGLSEDEKRVLEHLNNKYRDASGKLLKGSFFVSSEGKWIKV